MVASVARHDGHVANPSSSCVVSAGRSLMFIGGREDDVMETFREGFDEY
jgi:hypothetical protein